MISIPYCLNRSALEFELDFSRGDPPVANERELVLSPDKKPAAFLRDFDPLSR